MQTAALNGQYAYLWQKYKPVILKLMKDAEVEPQTYQFQPHEFADLNNQRTTGYSFKLEVYENRKSNEPKSKVANDLLNILQSSSTAEELTSEDPYQFKMDSKFELEVSRMPSN